MHVFRCSDCPATQTYSADLLDEGQARCLLQVASGWHVIEPEGSTLTIFWCPVCYRRRVPWTPPPPRAPRRRST
jgi:hypothetical protein